MIILNTIINIFIEIIIVVIPLFLIVAYTTYSERKIIGYMQSRLGPTRVGPSGIFQPIADVIKLATKEIIIPSNSNKRTISNCANNNASTISDGMVSNSSF